MKVLHVCTIPLTARTFIASLARYLETRGYEVTIACSEDADQESGTTMEEMRAGGFRMKAIPIPRHIQPIGDLRAILELFRFIREERFAIVHTQTSKAGFVGRAAARLAGVPVIIHTAHAFPFHPYLPPYVIRLYAMVERWAGRLSDVIMVDTDAIRAEGLRRRVAPPDKIVTVHMGIDLDRFSPAVADGSRVRRELGIGADDLVVGTVARLVPDKGLECMLQAAAAIAPRWPPLRLLIVGGGPLRCRLEAQAREGGIADRVIFVGVRSDIPDLLAAMDIFVLPTRREGFGVVFAEAMAMENPVIGGDIPPVREVVGDAGILLPPAAPDRFAGAIDALLADRAKRRALGLAGRRRVQELFDQRNMFARVESEYRRLLAQKGLAAS